MHEGLGCIAARKPLELLASVAGWLMISVLHCAAQDVNGAAFAGRQITISVGTGPGSPASLYSQAVARHMGRHIPGYPGVVVQHMPGAGGLLAANTAYNNLPRDGTALATTNSTIFLEPLLGGKGAQFDAKSFNWIGGTHVERMTCITWHASGVKSLQDAMARPAIIGSYGAEGPSAKIAMAANRFVGTQLSLITGYASSPEALLAMVRGETDGFCAMGWDELKLRQADWLREKKVNLLFQVGLVKDGELRDVPLLLDHARSPLDRKAMELLFMPLEIGRPIYAPPGVPSDRVEMLRSALAQTLRDMAFLADADRAGLPVQHVSGERIQSLIEQIYSAPKDVLERARTAAQ